MKKRVVALIAILVMIVSCMPVMALENNGVPASSKEAAPGFAKAGQLSVGIRKAANTKVTGLVKQGGRWVFLRNGKLYEYTGLVQRPDNKKWYYVKKGIYDKTYTGLAKSYANGSWYYVKNGAYKANYTGFAKSPINGRWYVVTNGKINYKYTGLAKNHDNGNWYYAKNGVYNKNMTGFVKYKNKYYVVNKGRVDFSFTGVAKNHSNGNWYYAKKGVYDKTYTGIAISIANGKTYYVSKGRVDFKKTGKVKVGNKTYNVVKGLVKDHTHSYNVPVYKKVHHDAEYETVTETKYREEEHAYYICSGCGRRWEGGSGPNSESIMNHMFDSNGDIIDACGAGANYSEIVQVPYEETYEKCVKEAYDEQVLDHYECSCGARK